MLQMNIEIMEAHGRALDKAAKKTVKVLVISNPANSLALVLSKNAPSIPKKNITCLTRLDHNRALARIAAKTGQNVGKVKNLVIWGNHSPT